MENKIGFLQKLKICWFLLTSSTRKNILTVSCEFCGNTNIAAVEKLTLEPVIASKETREYQAKYICMNCKASCCCTQQWSKITDEAMAKIKQQIGVRREKYYNFNCPKCMCLVGAKHSDLTWKSNRRNGEYCKLKCPECGARITGGGQNRVEYL